MNDPSQSPDRRFLGVVLIFGVAALFVSIHWIDAGSIILRHSSGRGSPARVAGMVSAGHMLFYPLCVAWGVLGACMVAFSCLGYFQNNLRMYRPCAYCCVVLLLLGLATVLTALLAGAP